MPLITCENLCIGYDSVVIQNNINFSVNKGDYLCIVGENGAGKSTLMKTLINLIPPVKGKILTGDGLKSNKIGYLPQQTAIQRDFPATVMEIVLSGFQSKCSLRPFYTREEKNIAISNLEKMGMKGFEKRSYKKLSGGQQQRVLLARALCATKEIILLDEPVAGLDPKATKEMYSLIYTLNKNDNVTVIMISHDINTALSYATHILHIGKDLFFGKIDEYKNSSLAIIKEVD